MKKTFSIIGSVLLAVILVAVVVVFAFEKNIPTNWASSQIEQIRAYELKTPETADEIPDGTVTLCYEKLTYAKVGDKTVTTIAEKFERKLAKSGSGEKLVIDLVTVEYTNNGQTKTTEVVKVFWEDGKYYNIRNGGDKQEISDIDESTMLYTYLVDKLFVFSPKMTIKTTILDMLDNNLQKVTQKGLNFKFYLEKDNVLAELSYNVVQKKVTGYNEITKTYDIENNLTAKETYTISI